MLRFEIHDIESIGSCVEYKIQILACREETTQKQFLWSNFQKIQCCILKGRMNNEIHLCVECFPKLFQLQCLWKMLRAQISKSVHEKYFTDSKISVNQDDHTSGGNHENLQKCRKIVFSRIERGTSPVRVLHKHRISPAWIVFAKIENHQFLVKNWAK